MQLVLVVAVVFLSLLVCAADGIGCCHRTGGDDVRVRSFFIVLISKFSIAAGDVAKDTSGTACCLCCLCCCYCSCFQWCVTHTCVIWVASCVVVVVVVVVVVF